MRTSTVGYMSSDGVSRIHARTWEPDSSGPVVAGIVQIAHGMAEHIERYAPFAEQLVSQGYVVCAEDHIGHGGSVSSTSQLGHIPHAAGADALIEDMHEFRRIVAGRYSSVVPYVMFGHSMGSYMVRAYLTRHADGLAGAIMCGTGQVPAALSTAGLLVAHALRTSKGEEHRSPLLDSMGVGAYAKAIRDARTPLDWLSRDEKNVDDYIADPLCGFMFSVGGYEAVLSLTKEAANAAKASRIPADLPMLFISGADDPVGAQGRGVREAVEEYRRAGMRDVDLVLYEGLRHEILNEAEAGTVVADVTSWLEKHLR